jgi:hypothetical protein
MRAILTVSVIGCIGASSAMAETWNEYLDRQKSPEQIFQQAVADYRKCISAPPSRGVLGISGRGLTPEQACEGLRHIMDASAQAAGRFNGSR